MKYCPNCNSPLPDESRFCSTCGAIIQDASEQTAAQGYEQQGEDVAPVINDQTYDQQYGTYEQPYGSYGQAQDFGAQSQPFQNFEQPQDFGAQSQPFQNFEQPQDFGAQSQPFQNFEQPQGFGAQSQPFQNFEQPQNFQNPDYINPASPQMPGVVPGKGGSSLIVPIILIILIIAVILIDVFWLFRDQIWGKKDESSTSAASYITMIDE